MTFEVGRTLSCQESFVVTSHVRADGDSIGSQLALMHSLGAAGKRVAVMNPGPVPTVYAGLPGSDRILTDGTVPPGEFEVLVVLDSPSLDRAEPVVSKLPTDMLIVNIDHHPGNACFGALNIVDESASSVAEILYDVLKSARLPLGKEAVECLYVGILTDTGRFTHENTTAGAFKVAGELVELGASPNRMASMIYSNYPLEMLKLQALAMQNITFANDGAVAFICVTRDQFRATGTSPVDTQEFANIARGIRGVEVGVFLREEGSSRKIKASLRSAGTADVRAVAEEFGGGGHYRAAGCTIDGTLDEAQRALAEAIGRRMTGSSGLDQRSTNVTEKPGNSHR